MTTATDIGTGLLRVREAHRYCVTNPIYPEAHDFPQCPVLHEFRRLLATRVPAEGSDAGPVSPDRAGLVEPSAGARDGTRRSGTAAP